MALTNLPLAMQSNPGRYPAAGKARLVNCYRDPAGEEGKSQSPIYPVDGLTQWAAASSSGGVRALLPTATYLYAVRGRLLERFDPSGASTVIGGIPTDGLVTMVRNRANPMQIGIVSDGSYWVCTNTTLTEHPDADLPAASSIAVLDGYFVFPGYGSVFYISDIDNATSIDPLDFASAQYSPDATMRVATRESELVFFGADSTEWWQDTGGTGFPFSRVQAIDIGCLSSASVARVDRTLAWVAHDGTVRLMQGYDGKVISNPAVARAITDEPTKSALTGTSWSRDQHVFYALSGTNFTWVYDVSTERWHERESYGSRRWRCSQVTQFAGLTLAGDATTGAIYSMSRDVYDEAGNPLVMTVDSPIIHQYPRRLQINAVHADIIPGQGLVPGNSATTDPQLLMAMSRDGGATFSTERQASMGTRGARTRRVISRRWGVYGTTGATLRLRASAAVARGIIGAAIDAEVLPS